MLNIGFEVVKECPGICLVLSQHRHEGVGRREPRDGLAGESLQHLLG